jgi:hypothetical protein
MGAYALCSPAINFIVRPWQSGTAMGQGSFPHAASAL